MTLFWLISKLRRLRSKLLVILWFRQVLSGVGRRTNIDGPIHLYNPHLITLGDEVFVGPFCRLEVHIPAGTSQLPRLRIGDGACIQHGVHIYSTGMLSIGKNLLAASGCLITDSNHGDDIADIPFKTLALKSKSTRIGNNVWLGEHVAVLAGADIGDNVIIGANSVVVGAIPANSKAVGSPARVVSTFDFNERSWRPTH